MKVGAIAGLAFAPSLSECPKLGAIPFTVEIGTSAFVARGGATSGLAPPLSRAEAFGAAPGANCGVGISITSASHLTARVAGSCWGPGAIALMSLATGFAFGFESDCFVSTVWAGTLEAALLSASFWMCVLSAVVPGDADFAGATGGACSEDSGAAADGSIGPAIVSAPAGTDSVLSTCRGFAGFGLCPSRQSAGCSSSALPSSCSGLDLSWASTDPARFVAAKTAAAAAARRPLTRGCSLRSLELSRPVGSDTP